MMDNLRGRQMRKIKGSIFLIMLLILLIASGCANTGEASEKETILATEVETEQETEVLSSAKQDNTEVAQAEVKTEPETKTDELEEETDEADAVADESETETDEADAVANGSETETDGTKAVASESEKIEYEVIKMEEVSMYASNAVNVRQGPSTDFERVGALKLGQEIKVTGQASTGWYEIVYGEEKAFVSDKYLQLEPVPVQQIQQAAVNNVPVPPTTNVILIGDSRTAEMKNCVGENSCIWIAEYSTGIKWFVSDAVPAADPYIAPGTKVIINLGANDPHKADTYIYTMNEVVANWAARGATVYYATVGPCYQNPYHTNEEAVAFNAALQNGLTGVRWIDLYSHMVNNGFATREGDGFHYDAPTYANIFSYYMRCIN